MGTLVELVEIAKLTDKLTMEGQLTLFGPTDDAFAGEPRSRIKQVVLK